jgi:hypothetical protein
VEHVPVLASEVAELLDLQPGDTVVDGTFGAGGHAALLEPQLRGHGCYIAVDRDPEAERHFKRFAAGASADTRFIHGNFALVLRNLAATGLRADARVLDLGISSMQIDRPERGFSYAADSSFRSAPPRFAREGKGDTACVAKTPRNHLGLHSFRRLGGQCGRLRRWRAMSALSGKKNIFCAIGVENRVEKWGGQGKQA